MQASLLPPGGAASVGGGAQNPYVVFQQIHDIASKRISTLDYLRKAWVEIMPYVKHVF